MTKEINRITRCWGCPFCDVGLDWCMRFRAKVTIYNQNEMKPKICRVVKVIVETEE